MKIQIASQNPVKIQGVKEACRQFEWLNQCSFESLAVSSGVSHQPLGLEETLQGAFNRAQAAFEKNALSVGIEGGVLPLSFFGKAFSTTVCCLFDGKQPYFGISGGYELPLHASKLILEQKMEMEKALHQTGVTDNPEIGQAEGFVSLLTDRRFTRKDLVKQATTFALSKMEKKEKFG